MSRRNPSPAAHPRPRKRARRVLTCLVLLAVLALFGADLSRPPEAQWSAAAAVAGIHAYQRHLSGVLAGAGIGCRFRPTCSVYAETAIRRYGLLKGGWRAFTRIVRCGPWTPVGTVDPVE